MPIMDKRIVSILQEQLYLFEQTNLGEYGNELGENIP
jgi:hypothetical protein